MICMQLYTKERESSPGASAATSICMRNFNFQGSASEDCLEAKVPFQNSPLFLPDRNSIGTYRREHSSSLIKRTQFIILLLTHIL